MASNLSAARSAARVPLIVILGATGAGKSKLALEIAAKYNGEIISADSMQIYKKLDIITNKVTAAERKICPHHLLDFVSPLTSNYTVVNFRNTALKIIDGIFSRKRLPIIVGGTNYYIEALIWKLLVDVEKPGAGTTELPPGESKTSEEFSRPPSECDGTNAPVLPSGEGEEGTGLPPGECEEKPAKKLRVSENDQVFVDLRKKTTSDMFEQLKEIDPERAMKVHPNDRRKILRSLEVFYEYGCRMSDYLKNQHREAGAEEGVSGPLRFPHTCIIWVQSDQEVLDKRTDKRVDEMIGQGLIQEMTDFHTEYNQARIQDNKEADYTTGIFQSIGFKEFHPYLILSHEERKTDHGKAILKTGIEDMKRATRQYSRRQKKWITNRFLRRRGAASSSLPPVYAVDSTDPSQWQSKVFEPACQVVQAYLEDRPSPVEPLPTQENASTPVYNKCEVCDVILLTSQEWHNHITGNRHKRNAKRLERFAKIAADKAAAKKDSKLSDTTESKHCSASGEATSPDTTASGQDSEDKPNGGNTTNVGHFQSKSASEEQDNLKVPGIIRTMDSTTSDIVVEKLTEKEEKEPS